MIRRIVAAGAVVVAVAWALPWANRTAAQSGPVPLFELGASWPKLPNNWVLGQTPGVAAVDPNTIRGATLLHEHLGTGRTPPARSATVPSRSKASTKNQRSGRSTARVHCQP